MLLSPDERARAGGFRFPHLRRRFVAARGALRHLLAGSLGVAPGALAFRYGPSGKPALATTAYVAEADGGAYAGSAPSLTFNVSHSADLALIVVARGRAVGVDVEQARRIADADAIAEGYFCPSERDALRRCAEPAKQALFLTYWTRKEALLKATGDGLGLPLDAVDVSALGGDQPASITVTDGAGVPRHLSLVDLRPPGDYLGAVAVEGAGWKLACWRWPPAHLVPAAP